MLISSIDSFSKDPSVKPSSWQWRLWLIVALSACIPFGSCREREQAPGDVAVAAPGLLPGVEVSDVVLTGDEAFRGVYDEGEIVVRSLVVSNPGDRAVTVKVGAKSCGCVDVQLDSNLIQADESVQLSMQVSATSSTHALENQWLILLVFGEDERNPVYRHRIPLSYQSARKWRVVPGAIGTVARYGETIELETYVRTATGEAIEDVKLSDSTYEGLDGVSEQVASDLWRIRLTCVCSGDADRIDAHVPLDIVVGEGGPERVYLPVSIALRNALQVSPAGLVAHASAVGSRHRIKYVGQEYGVQSGFLDLTAEIMPPCSWIRVSHGSESELYVDIDPGASGTYGGFVELRDAGGQIQGRIPISVLESTLALK